MENLLSQYSPYFTNLKEWIFALSIIPATIVLNSGLRLLLNNPRKWPKRWTTGGDVFFLQQIGPSISGVIYILGLNFFVELAPLNGRAYSWLANSLFVLSVTLGLNLAQRAALLGVQWTSQKVNHEETLDAGFVPLLRNVVTIFIALTGGIIILKHFNYDVMSLITALGVGSLAVGLAAKDTLSNMISGFILLIDRNLKPGDRINLNGSIGDVKIIGLRSTQIRVNDGNTLIVPNSELVNNRILNLSIHSRELLSSIQIRVPCTVPFSKVKALCLHVCTQVEKISKGKPPSVNLISLSEGHQVIGISVWTPDFIDSVVAVSNFNEKLLDCFSQESIPLVARPTCRCSDHP